MKNCRIRTLLTVILLLMAWLTTWPVAKAFSWSNDKQFTTASSLDLSPAMTQTADKKIWMFWHLKPRVGDIATSDIYYNYSDNGVTWSRGFPLTTDLGNDGTPAAVTARDGKIWVFWVTDRDNNYEIYYRNSANNGITWSSEFRLTYSNYTDRRPSVIQAQDGAMWVVWYSDRSGNNDLWYTIFDGWQWGQDTQLTSDSNSDWEPSIIQDNSGKIWVFWSAYRTGDYELYYKTSSDNGANWSDETQLTDAKNGWDQLPSAIQAKDGKIWVVWMADRNGPDFDIFYKIYDGFSWTGDDVIVTGNAEDKQPTIFQSSDTTIWISWASTRLDDYDIFYKTTVNAHDVAIANIEFPKAEVYQGNIVPIDVEARNHGDNAENFEVRCYVGSSLLGSEAISLDPGQIQSIPFPWNTSSTAIGRYFISATAGIVFGEVNVVDNTYVTSAVQIKIPGDVNGDGIVNVYDAVHMVRDIDATPNSPKWNNGRSDINDDAIVDVFDITILSTNYGSTGS